MGFRRSRRSVGALLVAAVALTLGLAPSAAAGPLDACAQRVIRDWYSGGRIDDVYPLACYRAAIRALPADVLQYSNADQDIRRALAFARRGRSDPGNTAPPTATAPKPTGAPEQARSTPKPQQSSSASSPKATPAPSTAPVARQAVSQPREAPVVAGTSVSTASVPYPILVLAALAGVLLAAGAAGWLSQRRD